MHYFSVFVGNHWVLWLVLALLVFALVVFESRGRVGGILQLAPQDVVALINRQKALVIDVRNAQAFCQGHIINAQNIELANLDQAMKKIQKFKTIPVIVYDDTQSSRKAIKFAKALKNVGFQEVQCLKGALAAWQKESLPLVKEG